MEWIEMIFMKKWSIASVEDPLYCKIIKHTNVFSIKTARAVLIGMYSLLKGKSDWKWLQRAMAASFMMHQQTLEPTI
jgi:hypothetical protein